MVKRIAKSMVRGAGKAIDIAPSGKVVCRSCAELRSRTVSGSIRRDWDVVGRTMTRVFESETRRYGQKKK